MTGYISNQIYRVDQSLNLITPSGESVGTLGVGVQHRQMAYENGLALQAFMTKTAKITYRKVDMALFNALSSAAPINTQDAQPVQEQAPDHETIKRFVHQNAVALKPDTLMMSDLKWKYLVWAAVRSQNIMMTGPAGCGKTMAARKLVKALDRPDFYFNLGSTQDPRATLIGNTQFNQERGTFFSESSFVKAIKTPNAVILLDELSRAHPDAWNILMTVLDAGQRYLRLDEADGSPIVNVAEGVTFIATANIGNEYTSTRVIDRAILDRFVIIEMDVLTEEQEFGLLKMMYPSADEYSLKALAEIAIHTRVQSQIDGGKVTASISTRTNIAAAALINDGFSLTEAAEIGFLPLFSPDGGTDSERTYIKQMIQKYITDEVGTHLFNDDDDSYPTF